MIHLQDVTVEIEGKTILSGVNATFASGKINAVIGPNGAGKTTLLKVLAGILSPIKGRTTDINSRLAWVPSHISMPFAFSVSEVVAMLLHPWHKERGRKIKEEMITKALSSAGMPSFGQRMFSSLSAGEQQRIALGAAITSGAEILLLDEPCANLDIAAGHAALKTLSMAAKNGKTIVLSIHDLQLAWTYAHECLLLNKGHVAAAGSRDSVYASSDLKDVFEVALEFVNSGHGLIPIFSPRT